MRKGIALLCLIGLSACVSDPEITGVMPVTGKNTAVRASIDYPVVGSVSQAKVGEDILRQGTYTEQVGVEFAQANKIDAYRLSAGFYPKIAEDQDYTYHSYRVRPNKDGFGYIPPARNLFFEELLVAPEVIRIAKHKQETCIMFRELLASICDTEHPYKRVTRRMLTQTDLQQKLTYSGRDGDSIRIRYSEESGHYARPPYSNETAYDLGKGNEFTYKGARIRVLQADNTEIRYQVLSKLTGW